ncbi:MAG: STAS domain-containing protein [Bacteroidota bacterium]|nr:STAS domain-containing protein [Bacteroidota bacterium]MDP4231119.1 STAS domain-containing protein [Bacteroidota bacterium]MDP4235748.1 STAS domain-containing protein [Bacteroidota bacterium]
MNFKIEQRDRATIFRPNEKRLDSVIAPDLKAEFLILAQPDVKTLVLDLSGVEYIDSAGLSALLLAQRQQVHHHGDMRIAGASNDVRSLLALTALDRVFPMYETVEEALNAPQLSLISVPPGDVSPATQALKNGMKVAGAAIGVAAIADLIMMDGPLDEFSMAGDEDDVIEDDDEYDDDLEDDDDIEDDDDDEEVDEVVAPDDLEDVVSDDDIEEIEEDDLIEADDLDLDEDDDDDDDLF